MLRQGVADGLRRKYWMRPGIAARTAAGPACNFHGRRSPWEPDFGSNNCVEQVAMSILKSMDIVNKQSPLLSLPRGSSPKRRHRPRCRTPPTPCLLRPGLRHGLLRVLQQIGRVVFSRFPLNLPAMHVGSYPASVAGSGVGLGLNPRSLSAEARGKLRWLNQGEIRKAEGPCPL